MSNENKTLEELKDELEIQKLKMEIEELKSENNTTKLIKNEEKNSERRKSAKRIKTISIVNLCIIPIFFSFGITMILQVIFVAIHKEKRENEGIKIAAIICSIIFLIIGSIISLIFANKELND